MGDSVEESAIYDLTIFSALRMVEEATRQMEESMGETSETILPNPPILHVEQPQPSPEFFAVQPTATIDAEDVAKDPLEDSNGTMLNATLGEKNQKDLYKEITDEASFIGSEDDQMAVDTDEEFEASLFSDKEEDHGVSSVLQFARDMALPKELRNFAAKLSTEGRFRVITLAELNEEYDAHNRALTTGDNVEDILELHAGLQDEVSDASEALNPSIAAVTQDIDSASAVKSSQDMIVDSNDNTPSENVVTTVNENNQVPPGVEAISTLPSCTPPVVDDTNLTKGQRRRRPGQLEMVTNVAPPSPPPEEPSPPISHGSGNDETEATVWQRLANVFAAERGNLSETASDTPVSDPRGTIPKRASRNDQRSHTTLSFNPLSDNLNATMPLTPIQQDQVRSTQLKLQSKVVVPPSSSMGNNQRTKKPRCRYCKSVSHLTEEHTNKQLVDKYHQRNREYWERTTQNTDSVRGSSRVSTPDSGALRTTTVHSQTFTSSVQSRLRSSKTTQAPLTLNERNFPPINAGRNINQRPPRQHSQRREEADRRAPLAPSDANARASSHTDVNAANTMRTSNAVNVVSSTKSTSQRTTISFGEYRRRQESRLTCAPSSQHDFLPRLGRNSVSLESMRYSPKRASDIMVDSPKPAKQRRENENRQPATPGSPPRPPLDERIKRMLGGTLPTDRPVTLYDKHHKEGITIGYSSSSSESVTRQKLPVAAPTVKKQTQNAPTVPPPSASTNIDVANAWSYLEQFRPLLDLAKTLGGIASAEKATVVPTVSSTSVGSNVPVVITPPPSQQPLMPPPASIPPIIAVPVTTQRTPQMPPPGYVPVRTLEQMDLLCEDRVCPWKYPGRSFSPCEDELCRIARDYYRHQKK